MSVDEKSFGKGHNCVRVMADARESRVIDVAEGRNEEATDKLWEELNEDQRSRVKAVTMDMWVPFKKSAMKYVPQEDIVHDRFHIQKDLNEAVDKVRKMEHRAIMKEGDETGKGSKQLWLFHPENLSDYRQNEFKKLQSLELKTALAWAIKEQFRCFWHY